MQALCQTTATVGRVTEIVAHRGFSGRYPEHTPRAFEEALALPIHGVECDVRLTPKGELVVAHDPVKTAEGVMLIDDLLDLITAHPDKHLYIETKHPSRFGPEVEEQTLRALRYHRLHDSERIHLMSFSHRAVRYFTEFAPQLETYYLFNLRERRWNPKNVMWSKPCGVGPGISHLMAKPELLGYRGLKTYTWTVNKPIEMQWCADQGVDVVATDLPDLALATMGAHGT